MTLASKNRIGGLVLAATFVVAACGGSAATTAPTQASATDAPATQAPAESQPATVEGSIVVSGSSTVEPISTGVAEAFAAMNPKFTYTIEGPGTGDGFKKFCAGETDISDASRKIKDEEAKACADAGIEYVEIKVAIDGMSVLTSVNNTAVSCLSFADLYALVGPESTGFGKWSDGAAIAKELGSNTVLPDAELKITGPGEESGTFDSFVELAIQKIAEARGHKGETTRPDYTASANDNAIIEGISGSDTSLGWV
ncbi:MAG: substrate-binding domain-containing protein, partial [Chloroflexota bacterium]|nr:substrate-binding domain-containing protein [Chloroflexota bacterium]